MTKRSQFFLTIIAIIIVVIAFTLDITSFGHKTIFWKNIDAVRILEIGSVIVAVGLLLGLFLFRKQNFKKRVLLTIPIALILFSCADLLIITTNHYGLNQEYNYFTAKRDIKNGKVQILSGGLALSVPTDREKEIEKELEKQYGYKSVYLGCIVTHGMGIYNTVMDHYLEKRNGKNWQLKERLLHDSLLNCDKTQKMTQKFTLVL
jgi:hypothetical protein